MKRIKIRKRKPAAGADERIWYMPAVEYNASKLLTPYAQSLFDGLPREARAQFWTDLLALLLDDYGIAVPITEADVEAIEAIEKTLMARIASAGAVQ
jgi:hypothetical protein